MNIEQIAQEVAVEIDPLQRKLQGDFQFSEKQLSEFLRRCLSKLAEQDVEPVAYLNPHGGVLTKLSTGLERETFTIKLYTETQLLSAQQKAAEACAKVCEPSANHRKYPIGYLADVEGIQLLDNKVEAIRNGKWREYL